MGADIVIRVFKTGAHAHRTPLSHAALWPLFAGQITHVETPQEADIYVFAHVRDISEAPRALIEDWRRRRRPIVLLSEEPAWDAIPGARPLAPYLYIDTQFGAVPVHQLNHHTSDIFRFDRIPYPLLTHHRFASAYPYRFAQSARRAAEDWQAEFAARGTDILFDAARPPQEHDAQWPQADLEGLTTWRQRFVRAIGAGGLRARPLDQGPSPDRHVDKLARFDGCARFMAAIEPAHQPGYMTERVFDAFACGAVPLYYASPHHRIHDIGLPAQSWVNLYGGGPEDGAEALPRQIDTEAYRAAQDVLNAHFSAPAHWQQERQRLGHAVMTALRGVLDTHVSPGSTLVPAPSLAPASAPAPQSHRRLAKPGARLARFEGLHAGERCVLVCNGPSLNQMDLSGLRHETVIGLNKIYLGFDRFGFEPDYLVAVNDKVIAQSAEAYAQLGCTKFLTDRAFDTVPADPTTFHMRTHGVEERFSRDVTLGVHEGYTVTHAALQIAYFMGFAEVIIIGMDHRFEAKGPPNAALHMAGADPNHFSPDYFRDQAWDAPDLEESEISYRAARAAFEADNRQIFDATLGGACAVFRKQHYYKLTRL